MSSDSETSSRRPALAPAFALLIAFAFSLSANAVVTINGVDESRVSAVEGLGTSLVTIYGGLAGDACGGDTTTTCSSCKAMPGGDAGLMPCNDRRINPSLILSMTITSDAVATGFPAIATVAASGGTSTVLPQAPGSGTSSVVKGSVGTISIPWSTICPNLLTVSTSTSTTAGTAASSTCTLSGSDAASATFNVGMKVTNDLTPFGSGDDYVTVTIALRSGVDPTSLTATGSIASVSTAGVTHFEFDSGDNKGTIKTMRSVSGFPNFENIPFRWLRVLFEKRPSPNSTVWNLINRGSAHVDLAIQTTGTDADNINLSPITVTSGTAYDATGNASSVSISNGDVYDTKVAVVDAARNVEFYTGAANDNDCDGGAAATGGSGQLECHTIRAAVVNGVLANKVNCFIATASYGSPMAKEVDTFRQFRDRYLIGTKLGLKFVRWYYNNGAVYADFIRQSDTYRQIARAFLWLPLQFAKVSLSYGMYTGFAFLLLLAAVPFALFLVGHRLLGYIRRRFDQRFKRQKMKARS